MELELIIDKMRLVAGAAALAAALVAVESQDPAGGWMAYAVGQVPAGTERITKLEMSWVVSGGPQDPPHGRAFYSPWFGMDPADNLNLIQPVNPWSGHAWSMYTSVPCPPLHSKSPLTPHPTLCASEYFQWRPEDNRNSHAVGVKSGQTLRGYLHYIEASDSYNLTQSVVETGAISTQIVKCQAGKKYTLPYVVYEKLFPCRSYPPAEKVVFTDIVAECDGKDCAASIQWKPMVKDANCEMTAHIAPGNKEISITWNTKATSRYDNLTESELFDLNMHGQWAERLSLSRPR